MDGAFASIGTGGVPQMLNLEQIGGALGIFAVIDRFFGGNPYLSAGFGILIVTSLYFWMGVYYLWNRFKKQTYYSISVEQTDESYRWLMEWFAEQPYSKDAREMSIKASWGIAANVGIAQQIPKVCTHERVNKKTVEWNWLECAQCYFNAGDSSSALDFHKTKVPGEDEDSDDEDENGLKQKRPRVMWIPAEGIHYFRYKGVLVSLARGKGAGGDIQRGNVGGALPSLGGSENLVIKAYTTHKKFLREVVRDARKSYYSRQENKTTVGEEVHWKTVGTRNKRDLSSVVLDDHVLKGLSDDLRTFINDRDWYTRCGVPYRRGYLLYGPPGTGKTSFILSIAGKFELSVCVLVLSSSFMNDQKLSTLIKNSPANSILLLEDVDVAFSPPDSSGSNNSNNNNSTKVSFSGLLNAIDGVAAGDGRILFMTTNHILLYIERLAPALIRPGRVDVRVHFDLASKAQIRGMFWRFYKDLKLPDLESIVEQVVERIAERTVSTAQLQGLFIRYKLQPQELLDNIDEFIETCKQEWATEETRSSLHEKQQKSENEDSPVVTSSSFPVIQKQIQR